MMNIKHIKISNYSPEFIRKAIFSYMNGAEMNRKRVQKYYATEEGKKKNQFRAKCYYWKKKKKKYHPEYNPTGPK